MSKKIALLAVAGAVAILGAGVLGYFSYGWINPPEPPAVTLSKGNVRGKVLTDSGSMTPAGIIVEDEEGNTQRLTTNAFGGYDLQLYPGKYRLTFTKGYEFDTVTKEVEVQQYKTYYLQDVRLMQLYDSGRCIIRHSGSLKQWTTCPYAHHPPPGRSRRRTRRGCNLLRLELCVAAQPAG